ncbi:hypothetical protein DL93DRAFT_2224050 [Clavulina sp. PMI_390]|nr:hypothetical protein DL93DRAFT_2224050 [Clavulina sp. PMI_390]
MGKGGSDSLCGPSWCRGCLAYSHAHCPTMSEPSPDLIAVLLVTASTSGANLIFRWPPKPRHPKRFVRPQPLHVGEESASVPAQMLIDSAYGSSHNLSNEAAEELLSRMNKDYGIDIYNDDDYLWHRSRVAPVLTDDTGGMNESSDGEARLDTSDSTNVITGAASGSDSGNLRTNASRASREATQNQKRGPSSQKEYDELLGYDAGFLAELLSPLPSMCHQKFELVVDELAFIGHPVHAKVDGSWDFIELNGESAHGGAPGSAFGEEADDERGRAHGRPGPAAPRAVSQQPKQNFQLTPDDGMDGDTEEAPRRPSLGQSRTAIPATSLKPSHASIASTSPAHRRAMSKPQPVQLESFHLILVLDRPDPSSLASTDLDRYIDAYYTQFAFKFTAAMLYEQATSNFIAQESHDLLALRDKCLSTKSSPPQSYKEFNKFFDRALRESSLAGAIRTAYTAVVSSSICQVMVNSVPVNIQLPPGHLDLLKVGNAQSRNPLAYSQGWAELGQDDYEEAGDEQLEDELRFGWKVPPLRPWKTVAVLDHSIKPTDIAVAGRRAMIGPSRMSPIDTLPRFLAAASPTMTLFAIAQSMKVDLETELYSLVRLLVYNRKAKILDVVRMVNVYTIPSSFPRPLYELTEQFATEFPNLSPLPVLLSAISLSHRTFASIAASAPVSASSGDPLSALETYATSPQRSDFLRVLIWMLTHDLLIMLHVRVRIYVTKDIKVSALQAQRSDKERRAARKARKQARRASGSHLSISTHIPTKTQSSSSLRVSRSPIAPPRSRSHTSLQSDARSRSLSQPPHQPKGAGAFHKHTVSFDRNVVNVGKSGRGDSGSPARNGEYLKRDMDDDDDDDDDDDGEGDDDDDESDEDSQSRQHNAGSDKEDGSPGAAAANKTSSEVETSELEEEEDLNVEPSFLVDPERATRAQRRWLDEIYRGHDTHMVKGFRKIVPYCDGKTTTDEIMYRTGLSRSQLRDILRLFDNHLFLFLHP